jgi:hypothetical protein
MALEKIEKNLDVGAISKAKPASSETVALLLRRVAARCLSYLAGLRELAQAG